MKKLFALCLLMFPAFLFAQNGLTAGQDHLFRQISFTTGGSLWKFQSETDSLAFNNIFYSTPFHKNYNSVIHQNVIVAVHYNDKWSYPGARQLSDGLKPGKPSFLIFEPVSNVIYTSGGDGGAVNVDPASLSVLKIMSHDSATGNPIPLVVGNGLNVQGEITTAAGASGNWNKAQDSAKSATKRAGGVIELRNTNDALLLSGTGGTGWTEPNLGAGLRLLWYSKAGAFRVGEVNSSQWNNSNIGSHSFAFGYNTIAKGNRSMSGGWECNAYGDASIAMGIWCTAYYHYSQAFGYQCHSNAQMAFSYGQGCVANGLRSFAGGWYTIAPTVNCMAIGQFNTGTTGDTIYEHPLSPLFQIGNGTSISTRSNAFEVLYNGNTTIGGYGIIKNIPTKTAPGYYLCQDGDTVKKVSPNFVVPGGALGTPSSGNLANCSFPTLNQNTSGTAAGLSATLPVASGGTGTTNLSGFRLKSNIVPLWSVGVDSTQVKTTGKIPIGYSNGFVVDTIVVICMTTASSGTVNCTPKLFFGPDGTATGTAMITAPAAVTSNTTGTKFYTLNNAIIPVTNLFWLTFSSVTTAPRYLTFQLIGHLL